MKITETNLNRMLSLGNEFGYILISACRQLDNPNSSLSDRERQNYENNKNSEILEKEIINKNLSFVKVYGGYKEDGHEASEEKSFFVLNYTRDKNHLTDEEFKSFGIRLCKQFNQDSVLVCNDLTNFNPTYFSKNGSIDGTFSGKVKFNDVIQMYYTRLDNGRNANDRRFTFESKNNKWKVIKESNNYIIKKANSILAKFGQNPHSPKDLIWLYDELDKIGVEIETTNATRRELKDVDGYKLFPCEVIIDGVVSNHYYATWIVEEHDFGNNYIIYIN